MARIILFNKPHGVLTQFTDEQGRRTLADFIDAPGFFPAGRLDRDSEGLLVLTSDRSLAHRITHPSQKMTKHYWVQVEGAPEAAELEPLRTGILLKDGPTLPAKAELMPPPPGLWAREPPVRQRRAIPDRWLGLTISEGRNRQVRRMCAALGFPVLRLIRYRVGSWTIDGIEPGATRWLD